MLVIPAASQHRPRDARQLGRECHDHDVGVSAGEHLTHSGAYRRQLLREVDQGGSRAVDQLRAPAKSRHQPATKALDQHRSINAQMKIFFHTLKVELVHQHRWATQARRDRRCSDI